MVKKIKKSPKIKYWNGNIEVGLDSSNTTSNKALGYLSEVNAKYKDKIKELEVAANQKQIDRSIIFDIYKQVTFNLNTLITAKNIYKSLQPGGRLLIMDFKAPDNPIMEKSFFLYTDKVLPLLGKKVVGDSDSYQYLSDSIKSYMKMDEISSLLKETNFIKIRSESLFGDFVSIHVGYKS